MNWLDIRHIIMGCALASGALLYPAEGEAGCSFASGTVSIQNSTEALSDTVYLPEITVFAIKNDNSTGEPTAVSTINEQTIEKLDILSVRDAADIIPNFYVPDYGSRMTSSIYVRGLGARIDQPAIGLVVDNVPIMNKDAYDFDIDDITYIRMLRGPQSTLYGRNTMAGLIDITTLSPLRYQGVRAGATYGSGNTWHLSAGAYQKFSDKFGLSLNLGGGSTDGFFTNLATGKKCDNGHDYSARLKAEWHPSSALSLLNTFSASRVNQGGYPYEFIETGQIAYLDTCSYKRTFISDGLTVQYQTPSVILSSITSWQYINDAMHLDQDFLPLDYFTLFQARRENAITQDFVVKSKPDSGIYSWLAGLFGFYKRTHMDAPVTFKDYGIEQLIEYHRNDINPYYPIRWNERTFPLNSNFIYPDMGLALYHRSEVSLGAWTLSAGIRLDWEHATLNYHSHLKSSYTILEKVGEDTYIPYRVVPVEIDDRGHISKSFLEVLPKFGVSYLLDSPAVEGSIYASVAKGYKAGGFNTQMFSDVLQQRLMQMLGVGMQYDVDDIVSYKPEKSWNYELGARLNTPDTRWGGEANIFYIDCRDQQLTVFPEGNTTGRIMTNAGKTRSWGLELSAFSIPFSPLQLHLSYGFTHAKFHEFYNGKADFAGKYVPYSPTHTLYASAAYTIDLPFSFCHSVCLEANVKGTGQIYWDESNTLKQPFYALMGASLTLAHPRWSLQFWGRNITDTKYSTFYFMSISHQFLQRGLPATCGVTLRVNFS
ncbi:MAG: TonB-dependent receptor [Muribaculaceae bacterium]|nr:TonB-dependent receptor [Muribaculaceae bacterium]